MRVGPLTGSEPRRRRRLLEELVQLCYPTPGWRMLMLLNASDRFGGWGMTEVCAEVNYRGGPKEKMRHKPLGLASSELRRAQVNCPMVNKEVQALVAAFPRLKRFGTARGIRIFFQDQNLV